MALPQTEEHWPNPSGPSGSADWDSLRSDLEALLHKVENSQLRPDMGRDNRAAPAQHGTTRARRQAALREVQRAVARFTEPVEGAAPHKSELQAAINEIRTRTEPQDPSRPPPPAFRMPPPRSASQYKPPRPASDFGAPSFSEPEPEAPTVRRHLPSGRYMPAEPSAGWDEEPPLASPPPRPMHLSADRNEAIVGLTRLTAAVSAMAGRLEKLESDMHSTRDASGDVAEIAAQVGQLTHVVELLAGAVGEQGQVKRLERQIADLARLYSEGPRPEITALTRRFDELGATVDRLAELQVQQIGRANREAEASSSTGEAMRAIEEGVRTIYDRIDALEGTYAVSPEELDRLTREMAGVAEALKHSGDDRAFDNIVERLDSLSRQIEGMGQVGDSSVSALRGEVDALRDAVGEAMAPRFAALESRLESLSNRVGSSAPSQSFAELEKQIRQLAERMDQTGEQLDGLTELYRADSGRQIQPDLAALASMVAESTSREFARLRGDEMGFDQAGLDALEKRLSKLFADNRSAATQGLLSDVTEGLTRVDERLDRVETALEAMSRQPAAPVGAASTPAAAMHAPQKPQQPSAASALANPSRPAAPKPAQPASTFIEPSLSEPSFSDPPPTPRAPRAPQQADDMPRPPSTERPLYDDELNALVAPVEDWSVIGLDEPAPRNRKPAPDALPGFDASAIEKPARPRSSLAADDSPGFTPMDEGVPAMPHQASIPDEPPPADRNTFIAAARRAARSTQTRPEQDVPHSLIGKALARFQSTRSATGTAPAPRTPAPKAPVPAPSPPPQSPEPPVSESRATLEDFVADDDDRQAHPKSTGIQRGARLLARHRRTLFLAGALVAAALLTLNLISQRVSIPSATTETASLDASDTEAVDAAAALLVDPTPTGSIDPFIKMNLTQPSPTRQILPQSLMPEPLPGPTRLDPTFTHSVPPADAAPEAADPAPIKLDLPPEKIGPLDLRQAAADGDAHAQFEVGAIFTEGRVVPSDFKAAAAWYERSAAQGFAPAQYRLGNLYEHGDGVDKDLEQARLWYTRAAEAGNRLAMHNLASLYASGDLGDQQFAAAAEWFERAADSGMTDSQFNLGMLYARGLGVAQDFSASYKWFALAAEAGDTDATKSRDDVGRSLSAADLESVKFEIAAWQMAPINIPANFAPIGTWSKSFDPGQTIAERPVTEKVQKALARLGYDPGSIDGVMGPKTTEAIKEFEKATGMNPVGLVNPRLLAVLGSQPV